jgi:hypothetical protein
MQLLYVPTMKDAPIHPRTGNCLLLSGTYCRATKKWSADTLEILLDPGPDVVVAGELRLAHVHAQASCGVCVCVCVCVCMCR